MIAFFRCWCGFAPALPRSEKEKNRIVSTASDEHRGIILVKPRRVSGVCIANKEKHLSVQVKSRLAYLFDSSIAGSRASTCISEELGYSEHFYHYYFRVEHTNGMPAEFQEEFYQFALEFGPFRVEKEPTQASEKLSRGGQVGEYLSTLRWDRRRRIARRFFGG